MKLTFIDRAIATVAPRHAADRLKARVQIEAMEAMPSFGALADDGAAPTPSGGRWWSRRPRDAKADTLRHLPLQRGASRDLARTSPIAVGAINTNVDRVVGTGLALSASPHAGVLGWTEEQALAWKRH